MGEIVEDLDLRNKVLVFRGREEAGKRLARKLEEYRNLDPWVLAVPAGGVSVGIEVASALRCHFDLIVVRKLHIPWNREAGFGSVTSEGDVFYNESLLNRLNLSDEEIEEQVEHEKKRTKMRMEKFRGGKPMPDLRGETVILVDDGIASGFSMLAAVRSVQKRSPKKLIVAVPTGSESSVQRVSEEADKLFCLNIRSRRRFAVAEAYEDWKDLSDDEIVKLLKGFDGFQILS